MPANISETQNNMNQALSNALGNASSIITKDYLAQLEDYILISPREEDIDIDIAECGHFYKLTKLVVNREENFLHKLITIVNVVSAINCSLATIIRSNGVKVDYYFGAVSKNARMQNAGDKKRRDADAAAFLGALEGNLIGSSLDALQKEDVEHLLADMLSEGCSCSAVSGVVSLRESEEKSVESYVQGIENLVDSLQGQRYTILMLADPISISDLQTIRQGYEMLYTQLSSFARSAMTVSESDMLTMSRSQTEGVTKGITKGVSLTQNRTTSEGTNHGRNLNVGISLGITAGGGRYDGNSLGTSEGTGHINSSSESSSRNFSSTNTESSARTTGRSLQLNYEDRSVKTMLDKIDKNLERLDECESFGAFDCAAYVLAENRETALSVASNYNALMRGQKSNVQASHINSWYQPEDIKILAKYLRSLVHPRFWLSQRDNIIVTPASIVSGDELAIQIGLPKKSISGISVIPMAAFGRNVKDRSGNSITLGNLYHMGRDDGSAAGERKVKIDIESLSMHTFITGSTGSGKTTAIYTILEQLKLHPIKGQTEHIKFMVIEPAKGEYKNRFGGDPDVRVYGTNYRKTPLLRIDPFSFPEDVHVLEHIDRLIEIFNVCWPMYAAMPAVLKDAVERAYIVAGWDLEISVNQYQDGDSLPIFPTFADVLQQVNEVMNESDYSADSKGDYKGALCTRLKSLTNGLYSQIFTSDELPADYLFDKNVIVDLSRTGSSETKALIMGLLVMKLQEHRMSQASEGNAPLKHVTVLEEAHNILKRTSTEQPVDGANLLGKSVEMLANSIAEMRTYGEGFIIADQAPGLMDSSVIRNTNTKVILRLPDLSDREMVGRAASLTDEQILELSRLETLVGAVYQNDWLESVLCHVDADFQARPLYRYTTIPENHGRTEKILDYLMMPVARRDELDAKYVSGLIQEMHKLPLTAEIKAAFARYTKSSDVHELQYLRKKIVSQLFNEEHVFEEAKGLEYDVNAWCTYVKKELSPDITSYDETVQRDIVAVLLKKQADLAEEADARPLKALFNKIMI